MGRVLRTVGFILCLSHIAFGETSGFDDQEWSDIGSVEIKVAPKKQVQRSYDEINPDEGLFFVGSFIRLVRDISLRQEPKGLKLGFLKKGTDHQILGFKVLRGKRFYKVKADSILGYIYAGTKVSYPKWTKQTWGTKGKLIAQPGDQVRIKRSDGAKLASSIGDKYVDFIPKNEEVRVQSVKQSKSGDLYYKIKYKSKMGFLSLGSVDLMALNTKNWDEVR